MFRNSLQKKIYLLNRDCNGQSDWYIYIYIILFCPVRVRYHIPSWSHTLHKCCHIYPTSASSPTWELNSRYFFFILPFTVVSPEPDRTKQRAEIYSVWHASRCNVFNRVCFYNCVGVSNLHSLHHNTGALSLRHCGRQFRIML